MIRLPAEQVVEAVLCIVGAIVQDQRGRKDVQDFYGIGIILPDRFAKELFDAAQIATVDAK
jgi:hypothetical protein